MEVLNLIRPFRGWAFPYISRIHTAYIGEDSSILGTNDMSGDITPMSKVENHLALTGGTWNTLCSLGVLPSWWFWSHRVGLGGR